MKSVKGTSAGGERGQSQAYCTGVTAGAASPFPHACWEKAKGSWGFGTLDFSHSRSPWYNSGTASGGSDPRYSTNGFLHESGGNL